MQARTWSVGRAFLICQVWAFALFAPVNAELTSENNRYLMFWSTWKLGVFFATTSAIGLLLFGMGLLIRWLRPQDFRPWIGMCALASVIFLLWALLYKWWFQVLALIATSPLVFLLLIGTLIILGRWGVNLEKFRGLLARAALILSLVVPMFWLNCLTYPALPGAAYPSLENVPDRTIPGQPLAPADNVYVFVCDAWSYRLTFQDDGQPLARYPNLRALAQESCVFADNHSPGCHTSISLPRLLFQRQDWYVLDDGTPGFWVEDEFRPTTELPSVFTQARQRGFRTYMVGWLHPYEAMLGSTADYVYSVPYLENLNAPAPVMARTLCRFWGRDFLGPQLSIPCCCGDGEVENEAHLKRTVELLDQTRAVLADPRPRGQFAVFHLPVPHGPCIFQADGQVRDLRVKYPHNSSAMMREQIGYLDRLVGEFIADLKRQGKYDKSIIVFTSDHTFRADPELIGTGRNYTHVPLLIHFPGQKQTIPVTQPFSTSRLLALLDAVHADPGRLNRLNALIAGHEWFFEVPDEEILHQALLSSHSSSSALPRSFFTKR